MFAQKAQIDLKEKGGAKMMLVIMFIRSISHRQSGNRERQVRRSIWKKIKKLSRIFTKPNVKQKRKDLETVWGEMIRYMMCLRLQRGWSKPIRILSGSSVQK